MPAIDTCKAIAARMGTAADQPLTPEETGEVEAHLAGCPACRQKVERFRAMRGLLQNTFTKSPGSPDAEKKTGQNRLEQIQAEGADSDLEQALVAAEGPRPLNFWAAQLAGAPWWGVSAALHVLAIALIGLLTMDIGSGGQQEAVIAMTELAARPEIKAEEPEKPKSLEDKLMTKTEIPATDKDSKDISNILVTPDMLAIAEVGDHFETINMDRPDTQSAYGTEDSHIFYTQSGNSEPAGGGGVGGTSLDEVIGVGAGGSPGSGGGWGGGNGTGIGTDSGSGRGSFGNRNGGGRRLMVKRFGGSAATETSVDRALAWLARHQEVDGHWDCRKLEGLNTDERTTGITGDGATTGFALLAFLGAGHTETVGKYADNVRRGLYWLVEQLAINEKQSGPGRFCALNYTQGIAALALAEGCAMNPRNAALRDAAQRACDGVTTGQIKLDESAYNAWDYNPGGTTNDTSVTGWNIMALKSAKVAGLKVSPFSLHGAMEWINAGQDLQGAPQGGEAEYWEGGRMAYRGTVAAPNKGGGSDAMMAAATLTRLLVGGEKPDVAGISGPCNLMLKEAQLPNKWPGNLYYWYYGTLTMFQKGGKHWKLWNEAMKKTLVDAQRKDADFEGSWDPLDGVQFGFIRGGRAMSTSLGALSLEVYYRYALVRH